MRKLSVREQMGVAGGFNQWNDGPMDEVDVTGKRPKKKDPFQGFADIPDLPEDSDFGVGMLGIKFYGGGGGGTPEDKVKKEAKEKAAETEEKLEEVVVEASRCGMPIDELFLLEHTQAGPAWQQCFQNLSDSDKSQLKKALDIIAAGFQPSKDFNPTAIAFNVLFKEEREMLKHLANAVATNNGWHFGENLASLSKGGWDSQLILGLIKGVFKTVAKR
jgi:hypothetical protein